MSKIILPLCLGEKLIGLVHLSSSKIDFSNVKTESEYMDAMMATFSMSVSRLQSLILSQHSRTESLVKSLNDGVIMFSNEKKIILMNPMATSQIGLTIEGASIGDISKLFGAHNLEDEMDRTLLSGEAFRINKVSIAEYYYEAIIAPVKDNDGRIAGCSLIMHDITYLEEVDRMKTEFVSVASHQLRTPLTAIKLFTDMLLKGEVGKLNAEQVEYLNHIYQSTDSMVILVYDLLNVTRIESGKLIINPQPTSIEKLIKLLISEVRPLALNKKISINFQAQDSFPDVPVDQNLFRQVIHNLITNAIRYSPEKIGKIDIKLEKGDGRFIISVADNGIGIPESVKNRMFNKFFRADNAVRIATEGTGLGLYVSKLIIESSGGKIWFESSEGSGTTFFVTMPLRGMPEKKGERGLVIS
jgi:signal transduction histidine kinase